eukprot:28702-Eustigmatos_ZCMA.PRE.1
MSQRDEPSGCCQLAEWIHLWDVALFRIEDDVRIDTADVMFSDAGEPHGDHSAFEGRDADCK